MSTTNNNKNGSKNWGEGYGGPVSMDKYDLKSIDPTLDDCCRREAESNRVYNALTSTLSRHDVTRRAERRRRHVINNKNLHENNCGCIMFDPQNSDGGEYPALTELRLKLVLLAQEKEEEEEESVVNEEEEVERVNNNEEKEKEIEGNNDSDSDDDSEFDYLLEEDFPSNNELEERRRAELEFAMLQRETARIHGYGVHRQMHPDRVLKAAGLGRKKNLMTEDNVVLHLFDSESARSASLDLILEDLAQKYKGTKFFRSHGRSTVTSINKNPKLVSALPGITSDNNTMPCLISIVKGDVIATCTRLEGLIDKDRAMFKNAVHNWLDRTHVLIEEVPPFYNICQIQPEEEELFLESEKKEEECYYDCGIEGCNKTFSHEHVGITNQQQNGLVVSEETILGSGD